MCGRCAGGVVAGLAGAHRPEAVGVENPVPLGLILRVRARAVERIAHGYAGAGEIIVARALVRAVIRERIRLVIADQLRLGNAAGGHRRSRGARGIRRILRGGLRCGFRNRRRRSIRFAHMIRRLPQHLRNPFERAALSAFGGLLRNLLGAAGHGTQHGGVLELQIPGGHGEFERGIGGVGLGGPFQQTGQNRAGQ